jgi:hypothetical protein
VTLIEEKLVQHCLRWFEHIQWRPLETPVHSRVISQISNVKRCRERPNLIWEEFVKRDLKDWSITIELELDRRVEASNSCVGILIFGSPLFITFFVSFFSFFVFQIFIAFPPFFCLAFFLSFLFPFFSTFVFVSIFWLMWVLSLTYPKVLRTKRLGCCWLFY